MKIECNKAHRDSYYLNTVNIRPLNIHAGLETGIANSGWNIKTQLKHLQKQIAITGTTGYLANYKNMLS